MTSSADSASDMVVPATVAVDELAEALAGVFTLDSFADGCAGASGGISAITVFYPLNIIRTRLQTDDPDKKAQTMAEIAAEIIREEGIGGMFTGWWGQIVALGTSNFVYFYFYNMLKVIVQKQSKSSIGPLMNLGVGAIAGVVNVLLTTPLWMVCTQLAVQRMNKNPSVLPYNGMWDGLTRCFNEEGVHGLWKGLGPNLMLVSNPTIHFFFYERMKIVLTKLSERRGSPITSLEFFCMGAMAKTIATILTYPIQIAQSQLRNDRKNADGERKYNGTFDCLLKVYKMAGMNGLFRGMGAKLWQTVLTAAFQFMTYEKIRVIVFKALTGKESRVTFSK